jgi:hypothetical protein
MSAAPSPVLRPTDFARALAKFEAAVLSRSGQPFESFDRGLPHEWEGYKEWVYSTGRSRLDFGAWRQPKQGCVGILDKAIAAVEIHESKTLRNNLVQWDARFGDSARAHAALLAAKKSPALALRIEQALFQLYRGKASNEQSFTDLVSVLGRKYDLIAYLFFLKDWTRFMPVRPTAFSAAFAELGMPLPMSGKCSWDNYGGFLERLRLVQSALVADGVPGVRLLDAHSFCWMLAKLPPAKGKSVAAVGRTTGKPLAEPPVRTGGGSVSREIDFAAADEAKRRIGASAQLLVLNEEIKRLKACGRPDLAEKVVDVGADASLGYDISSFFEDGQPKPIEVKAASVSGRLWRFFISSNELAKSKALKGYTVALVSGCETLSPEIWEFTGKDLPAQALTPVNFRVSVSKS